MGGIDTVPSSSPTAAPSTEPPATAPLPVEPVPTPSSTTPAGSGTDTPPPGPSITPVVENPLANADVGTKVMHRLSNIEYDNTVRALLGTELRPAEAFIHEEAEGFDNIAEALSMSPRQVEGYFNAGKMLAAEVFASEALRERIVACALDAQDRSCAESSIADFGRRAFRRPLEPAELDWLLAVYQQALDLGESPDGAMQHVVHVTLSAPQFLYRIEFDPDPSDSVPHPLNAYELASRLSYALWSSMPDESLFALAESGELLSPAVLEAEVDRMLDDEQAEILAVNFAGQWLGGRRLAQHVASPTVYPSWNEELAQAMRREMELYFMEFLKGDLPYTDFLKADFNFVNPALAEHYGMASPAGTGFERVENTTDARNGLLGLAGFLTHTSRETRSSPIIRGKWILDAAWCVSLKVPPDLVIEPLPEPAEGSAPTTVREQIATHRADPACAPCHNLIDPIGLALEHFDGIGRHRVEYEDGLPIEAAGELPGGIVVDDLASLSTALSESPQFVPCAAEKLHAFALGRLDTDDAYLDDIVERWTTRGLTLRNLIKTTVLSDTFLMRRAVTP